MDRTIIIVVGWLVIALVLVLLFRSTIGYFREAKVLKKRYVIAIGVAFTFFSIITVIGFLTDSVAIERGIGYSAWFLVLRYVVGSLGIILIVDTVNRLRRRRQQRS